jgi:hypothetical protein
VLVAAGRISRALTRRSPEPFRTATRFDLPLLLFLVSAAVGAWLAFDPAAGWAKFWQVAGGIALFDSLVYAPDEAVVLRLRVAPVSWLLLLLPSTIAGYFLLTADWSTAMGKAPLLDPAMRWLASWQPQAPVHVLHPNVAGGLIAALIPLQIAAASGLASGAPKGLRAIGGLLVAVSFAGLLLTASRGAWVALAVVGAAWLICAVPRRQREKAWGRRWPRQVWPVLAGLALAMLATGGALAWSWGPLLAPGGRADLLRNSIDLALDTPFTGIGLGKGIFQMAYSSYVLMLHVGHTIHSHVLPLNIWLEQGLLGLAACVWLLVGAARARYASAAWRAAGLASLGVILLHGLVDDPFYGSRGVVLLFIPLAVLAREDLRAAEQTQAWQARGLGWKGGVAVGALAAAAVLSLALLPPVRAAFQANLGALSQTRAELSVYRWPEWPLQDAVRLSPEVNLEPAVARYRVALALDPANPTANRRLGQIERSRGEYDAARAHLEAAEAAAPGQRATRQLLGEAYAISGDPARAAAMWQGIDLDQGQISLRVWWYEHAGEKQRAAGLLEAEALGSKE